MKMFAPKRPTSRRRLLSTPTTRTAFLIGLIAAVAVVSTTSLAHTIGENLFAGVSAVIRVNKPETKAATASHSLHSHSEEAAASESSTMNVERSGHTATRLSDGRVLVAGGANGTGALNESEIYDPVSATFSTAGNMGTARADHSATLLADGRVLIAGGRNGGGAVASTEIFDPATGAFTSGPSLSVARAGHSATLFADGRVFGAGGGRA